METNCDSPAKNTRSNRKEESLSPTKVVEDKGVRDIKRIQLTPIPKSQRPKQKLKASEVHNELIIAQRSASRGYNQGLQPSQSSGSSHNLKRVRISESTLLKLNKYRSPTYDKQQKGLLTKDKELQSDLNNSVASNCSYATCLEDNTIDEARCNHTNDLNLKDSQSRSPVNTINSDTEEETEVILKKRVSSYLCQNTEKMADHQNITNAEVQAVQLATLPDDATATERIMFSMLSNIQTRMSNLETSIKDNQITTSKTTRQVEELEKAVSEQKLEQQNRDSQVNTMFNQMTQVIQHQEEAIKDLQRQVDDVFFRMSKDSVAIDGLLEVPNENSIQLVRNFLNQILQVAEPIAIQNAYRLGEPTEGKTRTMQVKLSNPAHKGLIYKHISNLKNKTNKNGDKFSINDQVTGLRGEEQRYNREVIRDNKKLKTSEKLELTLKKGTLYMGDDEITPLIDCPSRSSVLTLSTQQLQDFQKLIDTKLSAGDPVTVDGSTFLGYSMEARDVHEINDMYRALRKKHLDAQHIVCAFRLPGTPFTSMCHYHDDGEIGAGRKLLYALKDVAIMNRCVFVVRTYIKHIGPARFAAYKNAARSAILLKSFNEIRQETQHPWEEEEIKTTKHTRRYKRSWNQGGRRGRGGGGNGIRGARHSTQSGERHQNQACELSDQLPGWTNYAAQWKNTQGTDNIAKQLFPPMVLGSLSSQTDRNNERSWDQQCAEDNEHGGEIT